MKTIRETQDRNSKKSKTPSHTSRDWWNGRVDNFDINRRELEMLAAAHLEHANQSAYFIRSLGCVGRSDIWAVDWSNARFDDIKKFLGEEALYGGWQLRPAIPEIEKKWKKAFADLKAAEQACPTCRNARGGGAHGQCELDQQDSNNSGTNLRVAKTD